MRLADFILRNTEAILTEWDAFARGIWPGTTSDPAEVRDHAEEILRATAADMAGAQSGAEQSDKSKGGQRSGAGDRNLNAASANHGTGRVESGLKLKEMVSEYRALRATVIRLWREGGAGEGREDVDDLTRFNESIDQSLARAVEAYTERIERSRKLFLAILGHDLRNPLTAVLLTANVLATRDDDPESAEMAGDIVSSAEAMSRMINDLLDFTGTGLGGKLPISPGAADLDAICRQVIAETRAAHGNCTVRYEPAGSLAGHWDAGRLRQVVSNLVSNAVQHGAENCAIDVRARGEDDAVTVAVRNEGPPIPAEVLPSIFDPLVRAAPPEQQERRRPGSIGLGLYIVREVVTAHGGTIDVTSSRESGTVFTARLPRAAAGLR